MFKTKDYDRFKELYKDKKYALAFAMGIKHHKLQETPEYTKMEKNFQTSFSNAQKLLLLNLRDKAKEHLSKYTTVISKQKLLHLVSNKDSGFREFLVAYEKNDFKSCYEIMDKHKNIKLVKIATLLDGHWDSLIHKCEIHCEKGNISTILSTMGNLLLTSTRLIKIGKLLRKTFCIKIKHLLETENFNSAEAIIYSYVDIFGEDRQINKLMKEFEKKSSINLAITHQKQKIDKNAWINSEIIKNFDS